MIYYFFPNKKAATADDFVAAGLSHALDGPVPICDRQVIDGGPGGQAGAVVVVGQEHSPGYYPDRQRWRRVPGGDAGVGISADEPTTPDQLARRRQVPGTLVEMADGRQWLVPLARRFVEHAGGGGWQCALPERSVLTEEGRWEAGAVVAPYARLWQIACNWDQALLDSQNEEGDRETVLMATFDVQGIHEKALEVLAYNYRLGPVEADLVGLLSDDHCCRVLHATVDMETRLEWAKKKSVAALAGTSS